MGVPTGEVPLSDDIVCNGVPTSGSFSSNGGALANRDNMNKTMLISYMTDRWYEGAILKDTLWQ